MKYIQRIALAMASLTLCGGMSHSEVLGIKGENHSSIGIYIKDLRTEKVVFESDAERALLPASVMKSFTAASALSLLGKDFRFETIVALSGSRGDVPGEWDGNIVVIPSTDPTLESDNFKENKGFCDSIAVNLKRMGVTRIKGGIDVVEAVEDFGPVAQWEIDDVAWAYGAGLFDFNYKDNIFSLRPATGKTNPEIPGLTVDIYPSSSNDLLRGAFSDRLLVFAKNMDDRKWRTSSTMPWPAAVFKAELEKKLRSEGISVVDGDAQDSDVVTTIYRHRSPRLEEILQSLMFRSDNMFAEGVLRALAPGELRSEAIARELKLWSDRGLETDFITVKDGSGLARADRMSARFIGDMLQWMAKSDMAETYVSFFPVAGKSGTMKSYLAKTRLSGKLAVKTGSMNGVQCYAGYMFDDDGNPTHVVVFLANSFFCSRSELRTALQDFLLKYL